MKFRIAYKRFLFYRLAAQLTGTMGLLGLVSP